MNLTKEQQQELVIRDQYAQVGINYDKTTKRFLAQHGVTPEQELQPIDQRPTLRLIPVVVEALRLQTVNP